MVLVSTFPRLLGVLMLGLRAIKTATSERFVCPGRVVISTTNHTEIRGPELVRRDWPKHEDGRSIWMGGRRAELVRRDWPRLEGLFGCFGRLFTCSTNFCSISRTRQWNECPHVGLPLSAPKRRLPQQKVRRWSTPDRPGRLRPRFLGRTGLHPQGRAMPEGISCLPP